MRVLHLIDSGGMYGAEAVLLNLLSGLTDAGDEPTLGSIRLPGERPKTIEEIADSRGIEVWPIVARKGLDSEAARRIADRANEADVRVIHCHGYKANILTALFARPTYSGAIVATLHGWTATHLIQPRWWYGVADRQLLRLFDGIVAVQPGMLDDSRIPASVRKRLVVVQNGIDTNASVSDLGVIPPALATFCQKADTLGVLGRLSAEKGIDVLLEAFTVLRRHRPTLRLAIIGDGPLRHSLQERAVQLGLEQSVYFAGFVTNAAATLPLLRCLVIPSHSEGLPMVLLEAMRAKVPVVATNVGGIPEALDSGKCGYLVPPNAPTALADALESALSDAQGTSERTALALERLQARYSARAMVARYRSVYEEALHRRAAR